MKQIDYSPGELRLLALLPEAGDGGISTSDLVKLYYRKPPKFSRQTVTWTLRSLQKKAYKNKETFRICSTDRRGPYDCFWWTSRRQP